LVSHIYTADPSAHVFEGKIYVYPSHVSLIEAISGSVELPVVIYLLIAIR
jgi:hypothetical protein